MLQVFELMAHNIIELAEGLHVLYLKHAGESMYEPVSL